METLEFTVTIHATPEKVWSSLWEPDNYRRWTRVFTEGSYYSTERFAEGSRIHFLTPKGEGMYSVIEKLEEHRYLAFSHLGWISGFQEQPSGPDQGWTDAIESYRLIPEGEDTKLVVRVDTLPEYITHMNETFPPALAELKQLAEQSTKNETQKIMKNPVNWFEIYVDDMARARRFYETVLDRPMSELPMPEGMDDEMVAFPWVQGGENATGALVRSKMMKAGGNSTLVYFQTEDCLAEQERVEAAGGKVFMPKFPIGPHGFCSICVDTEGNMFGLHSMR